MKRMGIWVGMGLLAGLTGCGTIGGSGQNTLRVGITPDYPPLMYKDRGTIRGLEADLARKLGEELGRQVEFVELRWRNQISTLVDGGIDIIMSGMSVTDARRIRVGFTQPYLETGLVAMLRRADLDRYSSVQQLMTTEGRVGYKRDTTAEQFVRQTFPQASPQAYRVPADAAIALRQKRLDVFLHDGPAVAWMVSANEAELGVLFELLTQDQLAWAVRVQDTGLRQAADQALAKWKADGSLDALIDQWLPYRKALREQTQP